MSRRRYRYDPELKAVVEIGADWSDTEKRAQTPTEGLVYGNLGRATDGTPIDSRTKHRNYMKENKVALASDYTETWAKAAKAREAFARGESTPEAKRDVREDTARALHAARKRNR